MARGNGEKSAALTVPTAKTALLCSAGLGTKGGGVGVVAELIQRALQQRYAVTHLEYTPDQSLRSRLKFALGLAREQMHGHALQVFSHIDLMRSLRFTPRANLVGGRAANDVVFVHGIEVWRTLDSARVAALKSARVLTNSNFTNTKMQQFHPQLTHARVAHLGVDFGADVDPAQIAARKAQVPTVVIVGRMSSSERYKGHDQLLEAWPSVVTRFPNAQLFCIGGGDDVSRLAAKAQQLALANEVRFIQGLDNAARDQLVQSAHLSAFPSTAEGFGLAAIEAAGMGVPVLAIDGTVVQEIFGAGNGAIYVSSQSAVALSAAICAAFQDPELTLAAGIRAAQFVRANYTSEQFIARFWQALDAPDLRRQSA